MINLTKYKEFGYDDAPSMREFFSSKPYTFQKEVIKYMESCQIDCVRTRLPKDAFTGEFMHIEEYIQSDEKYIWTSPLIYYVKKYNLRLPEDFVQHVLTKINKS